MSSIFRLLPLEVNEQWGVIPYSTITYCTICQRSKSWEKANVKLEKRGLNFYFFTLKTHFDNNSVFLTRLWPFSEAAFLPGRFSRCVHTRY